MSNVYKQLNCFDGIAGAAFGGGSGSGSSKNKKKKNNEQVYIGGHVGYVSKTPTSQVRNDQGAILNKSKFKAEGGGCTTENEVAFSAGVVGVFAVNPYVTVPAAVVGTLAASKSFHECGGF